MQLFWLSLLTGLGTARIALQPGSLETFDLSRFQVSESPKIWVVDNLLSETLLTHVDYDFEHYNETNKEIEKKKKAPHFEKAPHFTGYPAAMPAFPPQHDRSYVIRRARRLEVQFPKDNPEPRWGKPHAHKDEEERDDKKWMWMRPEDATSLVDTIKRLGHVRHSYQDRIAIMEMAEGAEDQKAHMDRYQFAHHPDHLQKTVNSSLLQDVGDGVNFIPRVSFVINFSDEGGCRFPNGTNVKFIPAKRGRVVMFENYVKGGSKIDPLAEHYGVYGKTGGKRVLTAGILYNGDGPDFRSPRMSSEGFLYFPSGGVYGEDNSEGYGHPNHGHGGR